MQVFQAHIPLYQSHFLFLFVFVCLWQFRASVYSLCRADMSFLLGATSLLSSIVVVLSLLSFFVTATTASATAAAEDDSFRPPMTPLITFAPMHQIFMLGNLTNQPITTSNAQDRSGVYWSGNPMGINVMIRFQSEEQSGSSRPYATSSAGATSSSCVFQLLGNNSDELSPSGVFDATTTTTTSSTTYAELNGYPEVTPLVTHLRFSVSTASASVSGCGGAVLTDLWPTPSSLVIVHLRFVHTKVPNAMELMQLPFMFLEAEIEAASITPSSMSTASVYVDMNAFNSMHLNADEKMTWGAAAVPTPGNGSFHTAMLGTSAQPILKSSGDQFMLDWGYLHIVTMLDDATNGISSSATATNASLTRSAFRSGASVLPPVDTHSPRLASDGYPLISAMTTFPVFSSSPLAPVRFVIGYDENGMQYFFGDVLYGAWTRQFQQQQQQGTQQQRTTFTDIAFRALDNYTVIRGIVSSFDAELMNLMTTRISPHYAKIGALAFRQTFAAIEFSYNDKFNESWAFLKEISSDGDINTMDVIFPASPLLFYAAPEVVKMLLLPVLHYAVNQTWHAYTYPFSPHQLGTYPVANITTSEQEVMPAENTGNMYLMLLAYMQKTNFTDVDWVYEGYWEVLTDWAMYMVETQLPVPPHQICTDDFAGPLAENTNLAVKCVIALEAYAEMCDLFQRRGYLNQPVRGWHCDVFHNLATSYADFWTAFAVETDPVLHLNHTRLAFNQPNTWSTKYNFLWQKILGLARPFPNFEELAANEVAYYRAKSNEYGFPMDVRHTYQKLDWMTWGSCLSNNVTEFAEMFEGIYRMANDTTSRWPLTDLYDTVSADIYLSFRSRPVVGAVFAAMMLYP
ncbi:Hypothetical protein, putative [Bodo saltans]|uniref:Glutaminase A central domain-containing protein n=1 Tax=Bodo saltans TaxID=75058 RepID=A0A0S4JLL1_BODSA|nr:Hypothetical protein, putative [Bodo saltans]|eukprot:CUG92396.1 Hypothetical protein, putative [Bodo saltans]